MKYSEQPTWEAAEAKEQLSKVIRAAEACPQIITRHRKPVVVVVSYDRYISSIKKVSPNNLFEAFSKPRQICAEGDFSLPAVERRNRAGFESS